MRVETKIGLYNNLFMSLVFGVLFSIAGALITTGTVAPDVFLWQLLASVVVGIAVGAVIPLGKISAAVAGRVARPDTLPYRLVSSAILLAVILVVMCPALTLFTGAVLQGAPVRALLPGLYALFVPFFLLGVPTLMLVGGPMLRLSRRCAGQADAEKPPVE